MEKFWKADFFRPCLMLAVVFVLLGNSYGQAPLNKTIEDACNKVVKVYGAGGLRGLEAYQSGFLISPDGHIATAWSYVLDVTPIVVLNDGRRFEAEVVGFEPQLELAVLKIPLGDTGYFRIQEDSSAKIGLPVLAISNLFNIASGNERASVMQGYIAGISDLNARRGVFKSTYQGEVLVLDLVANNPGAAGGALITRDGQLIGMLGKELRDSRSGAWLNYAIPMVSLRPRLLAIITGEAITQAPPEKVLSEAESHNCQTLGLLLIPNVLDQTPAFVDAVVPNSPADKAGLISDDLILLVDQVRIENQNSLQDQLRRLDKRDAVSLIIQRGSQILPVTLSP